MVHVFPVCSLTGIGKYMLRLTEFLFLKTITIHYRKSNSKSKLFTFKSYSQVLGIRFAQCHLQPHLEVKWDTIHHWKAADSSHGFFFFFSERSHIFDKRIYWSGDAPATELASKSVGAKCVFAGFTWLGITLMDCGKMAELKPHHPLPFQSLHKYSSTIPYGKITSIPLIKLLLSPIYKPGQQLPLWSRTHRKGYLYPKCTAKISQTHLVST